MDCRQPSNGAARGAGWCTSTHKALGFEAAKDRLNLHSASTCSSPGSCLADPGDVRDTPSMDHLVAVRVKNTFLEVYSRAARRREILPPGRSRSLPHLPRLPSERRGPERRSPTCQPAAECQGSALLSIPPTPELGTLGAWSSAGILHISELAAARAPPMPPPASTPHLLSAAPFPSPPPPSASPLLPPRAAAAQGPRKSDSCRPALSEAAASFNELAFWSSSPIAGGLPTMQGPPPPIEEAGEFLSGDESGQPPENEELRSADQSTTASEESPSKGSVSHASGKCKPCAFVHREGGCDAGLDCLFCHLCDPGEKKKRRKDRYQAIKTRRLRREANRASGVCPSVSDLRNEHALLSN